MISSSWYLIVSHASVTFLSTLCWLELLFDYLTSQNSNQEIKFHPLTPMSNHERISSYSVNAISSRQLMRIKKKIAINGLLVDLIRNSLN